jgi:hypothetical protein
MLYVQLETSLPEHPKTFRLMDAAGVERDRAIGWCCSLWVWALGQEIPVDGALPPMGGRAWQAIVGCPESFRDAVPELLHQAGFLDKRPDGGYAIHGWSERGGKTLADRAVKRERDLQRLAKVCHPNVTDKMANRERIASESPASRERFAPPDQSRVEQHRSEQEKTLPAARANESDFDEFWRAYPRKEGKGRCQKLWTKLHPEVRAIALQAATEYRRATDCWPVAERQFIPHPATWISHKRWDDDRSLWRSRGSGSSLPPGSAAPPPGDSLMDATEALENASGDAPEPRSERPKPPPDCRKPPPRKPPETDLTFDP